MQSIKSFLAQYNITTHTLAAAFASLSLFYAASPEAHTYINSVAAAIYNALPHWLAGAITGLIIPYLIYRKGLSAKGQLAVAADLAKVQPQAAAQVVDYAATAPKVDTAVHVDNAAKALTTVALLLAAGMLTLGVVGCTPTSVAGDIVTWGNQIVATAPIADSIASLADPSAAPLFAQITKDVQTLAPPVIAAAQAYQTGATSGNLAALVSAFNALQNGIDADVLQAAGIKDAKSKQTAENVLAAISAALAAIQADVAKLPPSKVVQPQSKRPQATLDLIQQHRQQIAAIVAQHYGQSDAWAERQMAQAGL